MSSTLLSMMFDDREVRHPDHMECDAFYVVADIRCTTCGRVQSVRVSSKPVEVNCCGAGGGELLRVSSKPVEVSCCEGDS